MFVNKRSVFVLLLGLFIAGIYFSGVHAKRVSYKLPAFTQQQADSWINSTPLTVQDLTGKVVLIDVWTYGCWNCYRSIPWMNSLEKHFAQESFGIVGIHTPEFDYEADRNKVVEKCEEFNVTHPVMLDNDFAYWKALRNRYWPTFYVVDKKGTVRGVFIGETHAGDKRAKNIEKLIAELIAE